MGPNFRYCSREYFDMADHTLIFTHRAIAEHLYAAGFEPERIEARFLPYSFTGWLPPSPALTRRYLRTPAAWRARRQAVPRHRPPGLEGIGLQRRLERCLVPAIQAWMSARISRGPRCGRQSESSNSLAQSEM